MRGDSPMRTKLGQCWMEANNSSGRDERKRRKGERESREVAH